MADLYRLARDYNPDDPGLVEDQRAWLRDRDRCPAQTRGHDALTDCLNDAHDRQQEELTSATAGMRSTRPC